MQPDAIDRRKPQKLYHQLLEILKGQIEQGEWTVGAQIPTEDQLSGRYNVSKATVRLAIAELVSLGYLKRFQGKGTYIRRKNPGLSIPMLVNLGEEEMYRNTPYIARILVNSTVHPDEEARNFLNLAEEEHCYYVVKLIISEGIPVMLQKIYIVYGLAPHHDFSESLRSMSIFFFLEDRCGVKIQRVKELVDISAISEDESELLELKSNMQVLRSRHICSAHGESPLCFSESFYRTELCAKTLELERMRI